MAGAVPARHGALVVNTTPRSGWAGQAASGLP
jgi:hypothetical protein